KDLSPYQEPHPHMSSKKEIEPLSGPMDIQKRIDHLLLIRYCPPTVVVNKDLQIRHFRGNTALYFKHSPGEADLNLLKMAPHRLGVEVQKLVHKVETTKALAKSKPVSLSAGNRMHQISISVAPVQVSGIKEPEFLVTLEGVESGGGKGS